MIGPLVGGWLVSVGSWRSIFLINVPFVRRHGRARRGRPAAARERPAREPRVDVRRRRCSACSGSPGPVFALIEAPTRGFDRPADPRRARSAGSRCFGLFVLWELRAAAADAAARPLPAAQLHRSRTSRRSPSTPALSTLTLLPRAVPPAARRLLAVPERARDRADHGRHVRPLAAASGGCRCGSGRAASWASGRSSAPRARCWILRALARASTTGRSCCRRCSSSRSASR